MTKRRQFNRRSSNLIASNSQTLSQQTIGKVYRNIVNNMRAKKEKILIIDRSILYALGLQSYLKSYPPLSKLKYDLNVKMEELDDIKFEDYKVIFIDFECFKECIMFFRSNNTIPKCGIVLTFLGKSIFGQQQLQALGINGSIDKSKSKSEFKEELVQILIDLESTKYNHDTTKFLYNQRTWLYSSIIGDNFSFKTNISDQLKNESFDLEL